MRLPPPPPAARALRAVGVELVSDGGELVTCGRRARCSWRRARSRRRSCCSARASAAELLARLGVGVVAARAGVGANLQDHLEVYHQFEVAQPVSLQPRLGLLSKGAIGARWLLRGDGLGATNHFEAGGFVRSRAGVEWPDVQLHFLPVALSYDGTTVAPTATGHSLPMHVGYNRSPSRGTVHATGAAAAAGERAAAAARASTTCRRTRTGAASARRCASRARSSRSPPSTASSAPEVTPGARAQTDAQLDEFLVEHLESAYHPCGTCRMGAAADADAVVDGAGRVHGVDGLRVVDASIFPTVPNGNLNAPTIMAAEKVADHILGRALPPDHAAAAATWVDPEWRTRQRERPPMRRVWDGQF